MASDPHSARPDPASGLFDFKSMFDAMEVARRHWSAMPIPSAMTPTLDPEELDKRIADLKTIEQWLMLNLNLLRGSVQTLELQRATLSSLQSFGAAARAAAEAAQEAAHAGVASGGDSDPGHPASQRRADSGHAPDAASGAGSRDQPPPASNDAQTGAWPGAVDPSAWWQTLQTQFQQVAESALAGITPAATGQTAQPGPAKAKKDSRNRTSASRWPAASKSAGDAKPPARARRRSTSPGR